MNFTYLVKVIKRSTNEVVKTLSVIGVGKAAKVMDGIIINLNKNKYSVTMTKENK